MLTRLDLFYKVFKDNQDKVISHIKARLNFEDENFQNVLPAKPISRQLSSLDGIKQTNGENEIPICCSNTEKFISRQFRS